MAVLRPALYVTLSGAVAIGALSALVAWALVRLIGLFTNLFFFGRVSGALISPAGNRLGYLEILVPVAGGLIVGLMAKGFILTVL